MKIKNKKYSLRKTAIAGVASIAIGITFGSKQISADENSSAINSSEQTLVDKDQITTVVKEVEQNNYLVDKAPDNAIKETKEIEASSIDELQEIVSKTREENKNHLEQYAEENKVYLSDKSNAEVEHDKWLEEKTSNEVVKKEYDLALENYNKAVEDFPNKVLFFEQEKAKFSVEHVAWLEKQKQEELLLKTYQDKISQIEQAKASEIKEALSNANNIDKEHEVWKNSVTELENKISLEKQNIEVLKLANLKKIEEYDNWKNEWLNNGLGHALNIKAFNKRTEFINTLGRDKTADDVFEVGSFEQNERTLANLAKAKEDFNSLPSSIRNIVNKIIYRDYNGENDISGYKGKAYALAGGAFQPVNSLTLFANNISNRTIKGNTGYMASDDAEHKYGRSIPIMTYVLYHEIGHIVDSSMSLVPGNFMSKTEFNNPELAFLKGYAADRYINKLTKEQAEDENSYGMAEVFAEQFMYSMLRFKENRMNTNLNPMDKFFDDAFGNPLLTLKGFESLVSASELKEVPKETEISLEQLNKLNEQLNSLKNNEPESQSKSIDSLISEIEEKYQKLLPSRPNISNEKEPVFNLSEPTLPSKPTEPAEFNKKEPIFTKNKPTLILYKLSVDFNKFKSKALATYDEKVSLDVEDNSKSGGEINQSEQKTQIDSNQEQTNFKSNQTELLTLEHTDVEISQLGQKVHQTNSTYHSNGVNHNDFNLLPNTGDNTILTTELFGTSSLLLGFLLIKRKKYKN